MSGTDDSAEHDSASAPPGAAEVPAFFSEDFEVRAVRGRVAARLFGTESTPVKVGRYEIDERLGVGGMGVVYSARDPELGRKVALKLLTSRQSGDPRHRQRLASEARALARLSHPNVVQIHEVGEHDGTVFLALELIEGETLAIWQRRPGRRWQEILSAYLDAARGLAAAHEVGIVHRDVKPPNILVGADGRVRVVDFGLAQASSESDTTAATESSPSATRSTSGPGVAGTPAYMSPEQACRRSIDSRSDLFSLCVSLFEGLYGRRPFDVDDLRDLHAHGRVATAAMRGLLPRASSVPGWVLPILARGLQPDPRHRTADLRTIIAEFEQTPRRRRRSQFVLAAALGLGLGGWGVGTLVTPPPTCPGIVATIPGAWDAEAKQVLRARFVASQLPGVEDVWRQLERSLDDAVIAWSREHHVSCTRTRIEHSRSEEHLDLAAECLAKHERAIRGLVDRLGEAGPEVLAQAHAQVRDLGDPSICSDTDALRRGPVAPASPLVRGRVVALRPALDEIRFLTLTGKFARAVQRADEIVVEAAIHPPLHAEALYLRGIVAARQGDVGGAERRLAAAMAEAEEVRDDRLAAAIAGEQTELAVAGLRDLAQARIHARVYGAKIRRIAGTDAMLADYLDRLGELELASGDHKAALARHEEAGRLRPTGDLVGRVRNLKGLANALAEFGHTAESIARLNDARAVLAREFGESHPQMAEIAIDLALSLRERPERTRADIDREVALIRSVLRIEEAYGGVDNINAGRTRTALALFLHDRGDLDASLAELERALVILRARLPPIHRDIETALNLAVNLHIDRRAWGPAAEACAAVANIYHRRGQPIPIDILINSGEFTLRLGRAGESAAYFDHALVLIRTADPPDPWLLAHALNGRGKVHLATGLIAEASALFTEARLLLPQLDPPSPSLTAEILWGSAQSLARSGGDPQEARGFAAVARELFREADPAAPELADIDAFLAAQ